MISEVFSQEKRFNFFGKIITTSQVDEEKHKDSLMGVKTSGSEEKILRKYNAKKLSELQITSTKSSLLSVEKIARR